MFKAPKSKYPYFFEQSMFETIWIIFSFLTIYFLVMGVKHFFTNDPNLLTFIGSFLMLIVSLIILKKSGKYFYPSIFGTVLGTLFCLYSVLFVPDYSVIPDLLWSLLVSMFCFYTLGTIWGVIIFSVNIFAIVYRYIFLISDIEYSGIGIITKPNTLVNVVVVSATISYLIHRITKASIVANKEFQHANQKLKQQNKLIKTQYNEKTILLQEIHHRVKNNLQVISSLIRLQSHETKDEKVKELFESSVNRIAAMALIHKKMYQGDNVSKINLEDYLHGLAQDILASSQIQVKVNFIINSELEIIGNRTIVPLALIFNELITNSLKHAFVNSTEGTISLNVKLIDNDNFTLEYSDTGIWREKQKESSFGLELIDTFTDQLDGTVTRTSNENGTFYKFKLHNID